MNIHDSHMFTRRDNPAIAVSDLDGNNEYQFGYFLSGRYTEQIIRAYTYAEALSKIKVSLERFRYSRLELLSSNDETCSI